MSRAHGKHAARQPQLTPEQIAEFGEGDERDIPGGIAHNDRNPVVQHKKPAVAEPLAEFRGMMAHGVPPEGNHYPRDPRLAGTVTKVKPGYAELKEPPVPVPVYVVEQGAGARSQKVSIPRHIMVPGFNADPVLVCGRDLNRTKVRLMNSDSANNIRVARDLASLVVDPGSGNSRTIGGALLVHGMISYQDFETQDELWAVALTASTPVELNIIIDTAIAGAA